MARNPAVKGLNDTVSRKSGAMGDLCVLKGGGEMGDSFSLARSHTGHLNLDAR